MRVRENEIFLGEFTVCVTRLILTAWWTLSCSTAHRPSCVGYEPVWYQNCSWWVIKGYPGWSWEISTTAQYTKRPLQGHGHANGDDACQIQIWHRYIQARVARLPVFDRNARFSLGMLMRRRARRVTQSSDRESRDAGLNARGSETRCKLRVNKQPHKQKSVLSAVSDTNVNKAQKAVERGSHSRDITAEANVIQSNLKCARRIQSEMGYVRLQ